MMLPRALIRRTAALLAVLPITLAATASPLTSKLGGAPIAPADGMRILILNRTASGALSVSGNTLDAGSGTIRVNSDHSCAIQQLGVSGVIQARRIRVTGRVCATGTILGAVSEGVPLMQDPLRPLPEPDPTALGMPTWPGITSPGTYSPGYYPDGISMNGGFAHLNPGIYVVGSNQPARGIDLTGDAFLAGDGVLVFLQAGARVSTTGSGSGMRLKPALSGPYQGVTVFQSRNDDEGSIIAGGGVFDIEGIYYIPKGELEFHGDGTRQIGRIIANRLSLSGSSTLLVSGL